jgi:hypothetical protein
MTNVLLIRPPPDGRRCGEMSPALVTPHHHDRNFFAAATELCAPAVHVHLVLLGRNLV